MNLSFKIPEGGTHLFFNNAIVGFVMSLNISTGSKHHVFTQKFPPNVKKTFSTMRLWFGTLTPNKKCEFKSTKMMSYFQKGQGSFYFSSLITKDHNFEYEIPQKMK